MNSSEERQNMELWNKVETTDPQHTKKVNQRGGFTAIEAQYQIREATRLWGPYGGKWGVKGCRFGFVYPTIEHITAEIAKHVLNGGGHPIEAYLDAVFYYPNGEFEISTDIAYKPGNDTRKKLLTDLTTKALSKLGFNADVFMGRFDGNKYTDEGNGKPPKASQSTSSDVEAFI